MLQYTFALQSFKPSSHFYMEFQEGIKSGQKVYKKQTNIPNCTKKQKLLQPVSNYI